MRKNRTGGTLILPMPNTKENIDKQIQELRAAGYEARREPRSIHTETYVWTNWTDWASKDL